MTAPAEPETTVCLHRWAPSSAAQAAYARACGAATAAAAAGGWSCDVTYGEVHGVRHAQRAWLVVRGAGGAELRTNGVLTLTRGVDEAGTRALWQRLCAALASDDPALDLAAPLRPLASAAARWDPEERAALLTTAVLALDEIKTFARRHPPLAGQGSRVVRLERSMRRGLRKYLAALGPQAQVIDEWQHHAADYLVRIEGFERFWRTRVAPAAAARGDDDPLAPLVEPLLLLHAFDHDREIHAEQARRLDALARDISSALRDTGEAVAFGGLATAVLADDLQVAAAVAVAALLGAYLAYRGLYLRASGALRRLRREPPGAPGGEAQAGRLDGAIERIRAGDGVVVVGDNIAIVDFAWAVLIWLELLERAPAGGPLPQLTDDVDGARGRPCVVIGGPITVRRRAALARFACEVVPRSPSYGGWAYRRRRSDGGLADVVADGEVDDSVGCVSVAVDGSPVVCADGFRTVGVDVAAEWVRDALRRPGAPEPCDWLLLRWDSLLREVAVVERGALARG